jgi:hypothetical protein
MRTEASAVVESKRATPYRGSRRRSPPAMLLLVGVASCTVWPAMTGDAGGEGGEPRDAASHERAPEAGAADREPMPEAEAAPPEAPACASDPQCALPTPYCVAGVCASTRALGSLCTSPPECPGGRCVDGVCCIASACPVCEACGSAGSCAPASSATACTTPHASASACDGQGNCGETQCESGYLDCDGDKTNGCETPISVSNCDTCGSICQPANTVGPVCSPGSGCGYTSCAPFGTGGSFYLDCDGNTANGCESNPSAASTCGSCGNRCGAAFTCEQGSSGAYACFHI